MLQKSSRFRWLKFHGVNSKKNLGIVSNLVICLCYGSRIKRWVLVPIEVVETVGMCPIHCHSLYLLIEVVSISTAITQSPVGAKLKLPSVSISTLKFHFLEVPVFLAKPWHGELDSFLQKLQRRRRRRRR
ncbi:hypothetical protein SAY87_006143 [Trapa incisa]|uniref:Uncharacterized protein n=1 Tax=Trapa incisa TaxID=236973 RepID=A0AAN7K5X9_9MYRT|nr:hypothetical protein SAY87_006143 [Trapa incisa]